MSLKLDNDEDQNFVSLLKDPFSKERVKEISLTYGSFWSSDPMKWSGVVRFKNGSTTGRFRTQEYDELKDCLHEIEQTIKTL